MNHLEYYEAHGISPVRYAAEGHAERRNALHRQLKLLPTVFRGADVLEVAAGSGQNAAHVASMNPASFVIVEPNPTGVSDMMNLGIRADIIETPLQQFDPRLTFDIVICENWLGAAKKERQLIDKLAGWVRHGGLLLMTVISETGLYPNGLRRQMTERLMTADYDQNVETMVRAFGPHLDTLDDMTRSHADWVRDNMLNPAWAGIGLTLPMLIDQLGDSFDILGTAPDFVEDWRWWKGLHGGAENYNLNVLRQLDAKDRWFVDYRVFHERDLGASMRALKEAHLMLARKEFTVDDVANMIDFKSLFGRETVHVSLVKKPA